MDDHRTALRRAQDAAGIHGIASDPDRCRVGEGPAPRGACGVAHEGTHLPPPADERRRRLAPDPAGGAQHQRRPVRDGHVPLTPSFMTAQCTGATSDRIVKGVRMASMFLMSLLASDWENQRAFLAVLRTGSLSAAARELGLAQPTVRRRIEALEQALGTPLFTRSPAGLLPTEAARTLGPHAEAMAAAPPHSSARPRARARRSRAPCASPPAT